MVPLLSVSPVGSRSEERGARARDSAGAMESGRCLGTKRDRTGSREFF